MTVAYEPLGVVEGLGTGVVEDTLLITETGYEQLSQYPVHRAVVDEPDVGRTGGGHDPGAPALFCKARAA